MRNDDIKDWKKLINPDHIDKATKYIRRLSLALHLAFVCTYMQKLLPILLSGPNKIFSCFDISLIWSVLIRVSSRICLSLLISSSRPVAGGEWRVKSAGGLNFSKF
jgi:hypothetical protein